MAAHKLQGRTKLYGLDISIENAKGSVRRWFDPHGKETGHTKMHFDYGYIRGTKGTDGDHVDVYIGPDTESERVFIVDQMKKPPTEDNGKDWTKFDEQKVMLAFKNAAEAKFAYLKQYDDHRFFGGMKEMSVEDFKTKVLDKSNHGQKVANGDMIQYFMDHPDKLKEKKERDANRKKHAALLTELNLVKLSLGEDLVVEKVSRGDLLGEGTPGLSTLPAVTNYSQASMSKQERDRGDHAVKTAAEDRTSRIADRVDDAGIGVLAAPYAADALSHLALHVGGTNPKVRAAAMALKHGLGNQSAFGKSHVRELAGLALVAPGVTHRIAKGINKTLPEEKTAALEKVASRYFPDYEYKTEQEKIAINGLLRGIASLAPAASTAFREARAAGGGIRAAVGAAAGSGKQVMQLARAGHANPMQAVGEAARLRATASAAPHTGMLSATHGAEAIRVAPHAPPVDLSHHAVAIPPTPAAALRPGTTPLAPKGGTGGPYRTSTASPPAPVAHGGAPTPVTTTAAAPAARRSWNPLTARNLALGGVAAAGGLATYGGYKGIQTASNILSAGPAEGALAPPQFMGPGRAF